MVDAPPATAVDRTTVGAIIPGYCEEKHVGDVVRRTLAQLDHVLVVDDGSSDATAEQARDAGAEVIVHEKNRGKGEAIQTGLAHWRGKGLPHVLILDADGQHRPEEIPRFLAAARGEADLLVGNRMSDLRDMPLVRRMVNRYMSESISKVCGQNIPDSQCGFRMLSVAVIPHLLDGAARFDYETEMLIVASRKGFRIGAVPISTVYSDEISSIHPVRDTVRFFKLMRRYK